MAGQIPGVHLSKIGKREAKTFAKNYRNVKFDQIYASPLERCSETIAPYLADSSRNRKSAKPVISNLNFVEMDYGAWSGLKLQKLALKPLWRKIQNNPITVTFPEGESFRSMRKRVDLALIRLSKEKGNVLIVTHGDIIKMSLASALGLPIDRFQRFVAEPASLTVISYEKTGSTVLQTNFKVSAEVARKFKQNQLGGGNSLSNSTRWWRR